MILKVFEGEEIHLDPALQSEVSANFIVRGLGRSDETPKQSFYSLEDLGRELVSMKIQS